MNTIMYSETHAHHGVAKYIQGIYITYGHEYSYSRRPPPRIQSVEVSSGNVHIQE